MIADFKKAKDKRDGIRTANEILDEAKDTLAEVLLLGVTNDSEMYFTSTFTDKAKMLFLIEQFKFELLAGVYDEDADGDEY